MDVTCELQKNVYYAVEESSLYTSIIYSKPIGLLSLIMSLQIFFLLDLSISEREMLKSQL